MLLSYDLDVSQGLVIQTRETVLSDMASKEPCGYQSTTTDAAVH